MATLADEFIWILEDTATFISGRVQAAIERYSGAAVAALRGGAGALRPRAANIPGPRPVTRAASAFLKSPVGRVFFDFFGENLFRTDMGIERGALGSLLGHSGPVGESERYAARVFGARPHLHGAERHLGVEPHHHVGVRRRR